MEVYIELCDLIRHSNIDVVLKYIKSKNINAETFDEVSQTSDSSSPLGLAIKHGHLIVMNELINLGFDPDNVCMVDGDESRPLDLACKYRRLDIILSLHREHGIGIDSVDNSGDAALVNCIRFNDPDKVIDVVKTLVEAGASVSKSGSYGWTPLAAALDGSMMDVCRYLVSKGADINEQDVCQEKKTRLMRFIEEREGVHTLRIFIKCGVDVNAFDNEGKTALMYAIINYPQTDVIRFLLESGADVNALDNNNKSTLCYAVSMYSPSRGSFHMMKKVTLLVKAGADVNTLDNDLKSPLMHALSTIPYLNRPDAGGTDVIDLLIESGANINELDKNNTSPLHHALHSCWGSGDLQYIVSLLIRSGANVNAMNTDLRSPVMGAVIGGDTGVVTILIESGANLNTFDSEGVSPLMHAMIRSRRTDIIELLVESGADVNALNTDLISPLMYAIMERQGIEVVSLLVEYGADVNTLDNNNRSPLWYAIQSYRSLSKRDTGIDLLVVKLLVTSGADVTLLDNNLESLLMHAVRHSVSFGVFTLLVESGTDVNLPDKTNIPPLSCVINTYRNWDGMDKFVKLLLKSGADVNALDNNLASPLMHAAMKRADIEVIRLLVEAGADVTACDTEGRSSIMHALTNSAQTEVIQFLIASGANVNALNKNIKSPLCCAIMDAYGYWERREGAPKVIALVNSGADVNVLDNDLVSPLMHALKGGLKVGVITSMIEAGANVNAQDSNNTSPLWYALESSQCGQEKGDVVKLLVNSGADVNVLDNELVSPLMHALRKGLNFDVITSMVEAGARVTIVDKDNKSALHYAMENYQSDMMNIVAYLVESGADVNALDINDASPLLYALRIYDRRPDRLDHVSSACGENRISIIRLLLESGADINVMDKNHKSPLHHVLEDYRFSNLPMLQLLVESGADVNALHDNDDTPLMYAMIKLKGVEVILLFLASGADVCTRNRDNMCPLSHVLRRFDAYKHMRKDNGEIINLVELFIESATDVKGLLGTLPEAHDMHETFDVIRTLCSRAAYIEAKDQDGNTVLHQVMVKTSYCCCADCINLVHFLIVELNLSLLERNNANQTPFRCALGENGRDSCWETSAILKLCFQAGYTPNSDDMAAVRQFEESYATDIMGIDVTSLQDMCCFSVRRALGRRLPAAVKSLPVPEKLQQRVKLTHVHPVVAGDCESNYYYDGDCLNMADWYDIHGYDDDTIDYTEVIPKML